MDRREALARLASLPLLCLVPAVVKQERLVLWNGQRCNVDESGHVRKGHYVLDRQDEHEWRIVRIEC